MCVASFRYLLQNRHVGTCCAGGMRLEHRSHAGSSPAVCDMYQCVQDEVGIDVKLLDDMQTRMLSLYSAPPPDSSSEIDKMRESIAGFCAAQVTGFTTTSCII